MAPAKESNGRRRSHFYTTGEEDVIIKNLTTHDDFLNRLCSTGGLFRGGLPKPGSSLPNIPEDDPDGSTIEPQFKVKRGIVYPVFNPDIPWNQMEPVLGMRYNDSEQLKLALCNYGVAHGYQLWFMKNDWKSLLVLYGRRIQEGRWIACQCADQIIKDTFIPLRTMKEDIRQKFIIDVSLRQCKRAKQTALYDHEGGLIDHHGKLWEYKQALIDSNPGTTCRLDVEDTSSCKAFFKRMYICFKGVKDGWLVGCRKGLLTAVADWLPQVEHKKCTRHLYANFKKRFSGVQFKRLFWGATTSTLVQQFEQRMAQLRLLDKFAYDYLIERNPNSLSRALFEMDIRCVAFENVYTNLITYLMRGKEVVLVRERVG
ncbi:hypothetical protein Tco_0324340 [Tanacetum coccineum]